MLASGDMSSPLSRDEVLRIAELAHLALTEDEIATFARQLADILTYVEELQRADTSGVPPTAHPLDAPAVWRADEPRPSLDRDAVLRGAPEAGAGLFKVPKVL
jgi:aspartyl-tRNA(Asn)/glutamyl-tRNA(Gln) amidotransferase subunit C